MNTHADKTQENKNQSVANATSQKQSSGESTFQFFDNRPETIAQRKLQEMANNSTQVSQLKTIQKMADNYSAQPVIQKREILSSPKYTANFKARHVRANNVTEDVAAQRLNNNPAPPSSTVIDQSSVPKSPAQKAENSNKISDKFEIPAQGWNAYTAPDGSLRAKKVQKITVEKNNDALIHHLDTCTEVGNERVQQPDGSWV